MLKAKVVFWPLVLSMTLLILLAATKANAHRLSGHPKTLKGKLVLAKSQVAHDRLAIRALTARHWKLMSPKPAVTVMHRIWLRRDLAYVRQLERLWIPVRDWHSAVVYVQQWFPGTAEWLLNCSSSEGGHGQWVPNRQGSGAGGWMQYMSGTFYADYNAAVAYLRSRGVTVPSSTASWYSPLGQAIAAGWARYTGHTPPGKWTGANC